MNELIMDYLVHEGFKEAAERFKQEAGIEPKNLKLGASTTETTKNQQSISSTQSNSRGETPEMLDKRVEIRHLIEEGYILKGQSLINLYYPEMLDNHRNLYFRLQQQHIIELIRQQKINDVLSFIHDQLSIDETRDPTEMEKTLALLAYENPDKSPYASLLQTSHRLQLASEINDTILQETTGNVESNKPRLVELLKFLLWTQSQLEKKKIEFPKMTDLVNGTIVEPRH